MDKIQAFWQNYGNKNGNFISVQNIGDIANIVSNKYRLKKQNKVDDPLK